MKFELFKKLYDEAGKYDNLDMYIAERGWQDWMDGYEESSDAPETTKIVKILTNIYDLAKADIRGMREQTGKSMKAFSDFYEIPRRTLQDWEYGNNRFPTYTKCLIAYTIFEEELEKNE